MRVLVLYERSNVVRDAFHAAGHEAYSCDLAHGADYQRDALTMLGLVKPGEYDIIIAHPPCTYISVSGMHWNKRRPERAIETNKALAHVAELVLALNRTKPVRGWCIENPISILSTHWRKPDQIVQPYQFGDDASKKTCLWLNGLAPLVSDVPPCPPRYVCQVCGVTVKRTTGRCLSCNSFSVQARWANQTDSGQNRLAPSDHRAADRAQTYPGIARAMLQWAR